MCAGCDSSVLGLEFDGGSADSVIALGSFVELAAGAAAGDQLGAEQNGTVVIRNSTVSGAAVLVWASFDWPDGRVVIRDSQVVATTGDATTGDVSVRASDLGGADGVVRVTDSTLLAPAGDSTAQTGTSFPSGDNGNVRIVGATLDAGGATWIDSGLNGRTVVRTSAIPGSPVTITNGPGGFCRTVDLTPPIACS